MKSFAIGFGAAFQHYLVFAFWWVIGINLVICGLRAKSPRKRYLLLSVALVVFWIPLWGMFPGYFLAQMTCSQMGGLHGEEHLPMTSDSVLLIDEWTKSGQGYILYNAVQLLLKNGLKRVEIKRKYTSPGIPTIGYDEGYLREVEGEGEYFVFSISDKGDPACKPFEIATRRSLPSREYRMMGLLPGRCIAIHREDSSQARTIAARERGVKRSLITYEFDRTTMVDDKSLQNKVEIYTFTYFGLNPYYSNKFTVKCTEINTSSTYYGGILMGGLFGEEHAAKLSAYQNASAAFRDAVELAKRSRSEEERQAAVDAFNAYMSSSSDTLREYVELGPSLVRWAVAQNRSTPAEVLHLLISDPSPDVSQAATQTLK